MRSEPLATPPHEISSKQLNGALHPEPKQHYATLDGAEQQPVQTQNKVTAQQTSGTLQVALQNQTTSSTVYAYISMS